MQQLPKRADVVVVGAGLMGAAAAWALSARGHDVVVLEARRAGHREGSSHGSSRVFRRAYREPHYIAMTGLAQERWRRLEAEAGRPLLTLTGGLDHGRDPQGLCDAFRVAGVECELLSQGDAGRRWPYMRFEGPVAHYGAAGIFDPELAIAEMLRLAARRGAVVVHECPVSAIEPSASGALVRAVGETLRAATVVVAAGPWIEGLLGGAVTLPTLTVTQQQVFHFARRERNDDSALADRPARRRAGRLRPARGPRRRRAGQHEAGRTRPRQDHDGRRPRRRRRPRVQAAHDRLRAALVAGPRADADRRVQLPLHLDKDEAFVIDRAGPLVVLSPCSGHGAKFAPLIGEWAADLAEGGELPYAHFGLDRGGLD